MTKILLHLESFAVLAFSLYIYGQNAFSWLLFIILLFVPDVSMLGYLVNHQVGAVVYNVFHTYILPLLTIFVGVILSHSIVLAVGLIWSAHIGMDRMVGYGLKYPTLFKDTHLSRV